MKPDFFIASRIRLRPETGKISTGVVIAIAGVALALTVMIVSVAVMLGFKGQIREKVMGFESQLTVRAYSQESGEDKPLVYDDAMRALLAESLPAEAQINPIVARPVILKTADDFAGLIVKGITPENRIPLISSNIVDGTMPDYSADSTLYDVLVSRPTASRLSLKPGDRINAFFISNSGPRQRKLKVAAIFDTHFSDFDRNIIFGNIDMLRRVAHKDSTFASAIEISGLGSDEEIDNLHRELQSDLNRAYFTHTTPDIMSVSNIHSTASLYFNWLALLDTNVAVILVIMILVSGLTLISSLFIIVLERVNMIGILKAIGASDSLVRRIFILVAERLVLAGLLAGNILAIGFLYIQHTFRIIPLDPEAYYLDHVPVDINWLWIIGINIGVILISALILIVPSRIIATISPATAIRFE